MPPVLLGVAQTLMALTCMGRVLYGWGPSGLGSFAADPVRVLAPAAVGVGFIMRRTRRLIPLVS